MAKERRGKELPKGKPGGKGKRSSRPRIQRNIPESEQQMQETLRQSEEKYRTLAEQSLMGLVVVQDFRIVYANSAYTEISGYSADELLSTSPEQLQAMVHPEDQALVWGRFRDRLEGKAVLPRYECRTIRKDGTVCWMEVHANRIEYGGKPAIQAAYIDITESKEATEKAQHLNLVLRSIRTINQLIARGTDRDSLLKEACRTLVETRGYYTAWMALLDESGKLVTAAETGMGKRFHQIVEKLKHGDVMYCGRKALAKPGVLVIKDMALECADCPVAKERAGRGGMSIRLEYGGKIYGLMTVSAPTGISTDQEEQVLFEEVAGDIAFALYSIQQEEGRRRAEEALKWSQAQYHDLYDNAPVAYYSLDTDGWIKRVNKAGLKFLGYSLEELQRTKFLEIYADESKAKKEELFKKFTQGIGWENEEMVYQRKNGEKVYGLLSVSPILDENGRALESRSVVVDVTERKEAAAALQKSEERYRHLAENAGEAIFVVQDGMIKFMNPRGEELSAYSVEEMVSKPFVKFIHPDDIDTVADRYARRLKREPVPQIYDFRIVRKDGNIRWAELNAVPISWEDQPAVLCFMSDITERENAEEALRQSEERYQTLLEEMEEGYYEVDMAGNFTFVNNAMSRILGYSRDELIGMNYKIYTPEENVKPVFEAYNRVYRTGEPLKWFPMVEVRKDGTRLFVEDSVLPVRNDKGEVIGFRGVNRDVTERKKAQEALRQSAERYRTILEEMEDSYFEVDLGGHLTFVNSSTCRHLGYCNEELIGMSYKGFTVEEDMESVLRVFGEVYRTGVPNKGFHWKIIRKDGAHGFVEATVSPLRNAKGEIIGFSGVGRDITERMKMEEQLILTDRLASVGQLAAGIAHELNNPLTAVIGFSDLLLERDLPADVKEDLETVNREAKRTVNIVKELLAFAREQKTEKSLVNINVIIQGVLQIRSYEQKVSNIEVDARFAPTLPLVMANGVQLQQVFINIIVNAEQAMVEAHGRGKLTIATEQVGNIIRASVTDDGPGISRDNMKQLFTPFFTTREVGKGTGLGLSICHGIVTEHGGKLHVESEPGKGATFVVELPISK